MKPQYFRAFLEEGITLTISNGNHKLQNIGIFNLPSQKTCPGRTELCSVFCYGRSSECGRWPDVLPCRERNLVASKHSRFIPAMASLIRNSGLRTFRIHESGDFYNQEYLDSWFQIVKACPKVKFMAYTKSFHLDWRKRPGNLKVLWSVWPDTNLELVPLGRKAYTFFPENKRGKEKLGKFKNPDISQAFSCPGKCGPGRCLYCWAGKESVWFKLH